MSIASLSREVWSFRGFITATVRREFVARYQGTQLGVFWPIAHPLAMITIYTMVFSSLMQPSLPGRNTPFAYSIYLTAGVVAWTFFSDVLGRSVGAFVQNGGLMKKVSIPKIAFPLIATLSAMVQFAIISAIFLVFLAVIGNFPGAALLALPPVLALLVLFAVGMGVLLGTINVFYRDVEQGVGIVLQFWFWLTPIVYAVDVLPPFARSVISWNPMWPIVRAMQDIFLDHRMPDWPSLVYPLVLAIGLVMLARLAFNRLAGELVDEL